MHAQLVGILAFQAAYEKQLNRSLTNEQWDALSMGFEIHMGFFDHIKTIWTGSGYVNFRWC